MPQGIIEYDVLALNEFQDAEYPDLAEAVHAKLEKFPCQKSTHLERFARQDVQKYERHGHSRTYVFITPHNDSIDVPAFFTIGMTYLDFSNQSKTSRNRLGGEISMDQTGAYTIAELARSDNYSSTQLPGSVILDEAKQVIREARRLIGGRFLVVDSREEVFQALYEPAGFRRLSVTDAPRGMEGVDFITSCCVIKDW